ncbi:MAG: hypothetical protein ACOYMA_16595 [Bacteroidia bacterium]
MKTKTFLFTVIIPFLLIGGAGCEKDSVYYEGKVISLNYGSGCNNIIEISKSIPQGLTVNSTITFDTNLYNGQIKVGDAVYFKINEYVVWTGNVLDICIAPQYVGQLEFYYN